MTILFVCTGNTCRSAMAEGIMNDIVSKDEELKDIEIISAGTGVYFSGPASQNAKSALERMNIYIDNHRSKQLTSDMIDRADLILTMTMSHKLRVLDMMPEAREKIYTLKEFVGQESYDIHDPFGLSLDEYKKCAVEIFDALVITKEKIKAMSR